MTIETRAEGTFEGQHHAGRPTGFRRLTVALMATESLAREFSGLGDNGPRPAQILAAFKAASPFLGYGARVVHAIDWFFRFTAPQDWREGARPIVWPSARMQQEELGLSPTRTKALNRLLIELGLIAVKESPNGKRYGRRDREGKIIDAYGFDLSPLAVRLDEFARIAEEGRAVRARMGELRRRATIARRGIVQLIEAAAEYGLADPSWKALDDEARVLAMALKRVERVEEMEIGVAGLERRQTEARARLETLLKQTMEDVTHNPKGADSGPHIYTYKPPLHPNKDTVIASENSSNANRKTEPSNEPQKRYGVSEQGKVLRLYPDELLVIAPRLKPYLRCDYAAWPDIVDAADHLRSELDISKPLWGEACHALGRETAAIAVAIVSAKNPEHFTRTAAHYFHGMIARAKRGELNLDRTIWGLRSERRQKNEQGRA